MKVSFIRLIFAVSFLILTPEGRASSISHDEEINDQKLEMVRNPQSHLGLNAKITSGESVERENIKVPGTVIPPSWGLIDQEIEKAFTESLNLVCILELGDILRG